MFQLALLRFFFFFFFLSEIEKEEFTFAISKVASS